jgi:hypothetical protein
MARLEDLTRGAQVKGLRPDGPVAILDAKWHGSVCVEVTYKDIPGHPFQREPDFGVTSVNYDLDDLLARAAAPS